MYGVAEGEVEEEEIDEGDQGGEGAPEEVDVEGGGGRDGLGVDLIKRRTTGSSYAWEVLRDWCGGLVGLKRAGKTYRSKSRRFAPPFPLLLRFSAPTPPLPLTSLNSSSRLKLPIIGTKVLTNSGAVSATPTKLLSKSPSYLLMYSLSFFSSSAWRQAVYKLKLSWSFWT